MSSFFSPSFDVVTAATTVNTAPADDAKVPSKDKEEVTDETVGYNGPFHE